MIANNPFISKYLAEIEGQLKLDWIIKDHTAYIVKELRIRAYDQMLQSYRSLSLESMAHHFGVSVDFIDRYSYAIFTLYL